MSKADKISLFLQILSLLNYHGNCASHMHFFVFTF